MTAPLIRARNLTLLAGSRALLRNVSFDIFQDDRVILFGMNGSGKTTLLSIIAGYGQETSGSLEVFGQTFGPENTGQLRRRIGFVSSSFFDRYYHLEKAGDIVLSGLNGALIPHQRIRHQDQVRLKKIVRQLDMDDIIERPYYLLSRGEQQKILIGRALISEPELLLLDEPFSGLDVLMRGEIEKIIDQIAQEKHCTIIHVTHRLEDITRAYTKAILLRDGMIFRMGPIEDVMQKEVLQALLHRGDGRLEAAVGGIVTGDDLLVNTDHDSECAVKAGNWITLGFMGQEMHFYSFVCQGRDGKRQVCVSGKEAAILNVLGACRQEGLLTTPVSYSIRRLDVPLGQHRQLEARLARQVATETLRAFPPAYFQALSAMRAALGPVVGAQSVLENMRETLRDRFDPAGLVLFQALLTQARESDAIDAASCKPFETWCSHEHAKITEAAIPSSVPVKPLYGFLSWQDGREEVCINANRFQIMTDRTAACASADLVSPIISQMIPDTSDFMKKQGLRRDFKAFVKEKCAVWPSLTAPFQNRESREAADCCRKGRALLEAAGQKEAAAGLDEYVQRWFIK
jgi:iron complex transport system ATP-binding protein